MEVNSRSRETCWRFKGFRGVAAIALPTSRRPHYNPIQSNATAPKVRSETRENWNVFILHSSAVDFRAEDGSDRRFFIHGKLTKGVLSFVVVACMPNGDRGVISGKMFFSAMMAHFGVTNIQAIQAIWIAGIDLDTNIDEFNRLTVPGRGVSEEEAARQTWTGQRAADFQFTNISIEFKDGVPGAYLEVRVKFTR